MSAKFSSPLNNIKIASPCSQDWDAMIGSERKRYCGECKLNVYNLSGMSRTEAENLITNNEGRLCVRFYRRADGSVLTEDCPVGWRALKKRMTKTASAAASLVFGLLGGLGLNAYMKDSNTRTMGKMIPQNVNLKADPVKPEIIMGESDFSENDQLMGAIAVNNSEPDAAQKPLAGRIAPKKNAKR